MQYMNLRHDCVLDSLLNYFHFSMPHDTLQLIGLKGDSQRANWLQCVLGGDGESSGGLSTSKNGAANTGM